MCPLFCRMFNLKFFMRGLQRSVDGEWLIIQFLHARCQILQLKSEWCLPDNAKCVTSVIQEE